MTSEQIIQMIRDAGSIDSDETILTVYAAIRSATKEEDMGLIDRIPHGLFICDANGAPSDGYIAKWKAIQEILASK